MTHDHAIVSVKMRAIHLLICRFYTVSNGKNYYNFVLSISFKLNLNIVLWLKHLNQKANKVNQSAVATHLSMASKFITKYMATVCLLFYCMELI